MGKRVCLYGYSVENNNFVVNEVEAKIVSEVFEKYLSKDEQALIKSFFEYNKAMADAQQDMSRAYKGGKIFAESIPFMLEFLATGGIYKGAGRAATKGLPSRSSAPT